MTSSFQPGPRSSTNDSPGHPPRPQEPDQAEAMDLGDWLINLWEGRRVILGSTAVFLAVGGFMAWYSVPTYQTDAMLQVQGKRVGSGDAAFVKMENLFDEPSE